METFLVQAAIYLAAAVIAVPISVRLGLGSVLGYLAAGITIGPVLGLVGAETAGLRQFAEFGVVMMLFLIGLTLEPKALWDMRTRLIGLGGLQVVATTLAVMVGCLALGLPWNIGLTVGLIFALSSTAIVMQTLSEKRLMQTAGGRSVFSVLLAQDIAVIPMLALLPLLAMGGAADNAFLSGLPASTPHAAAHVAAPSLVADLPGWGTALATLGAVAAVILVGTYLTRPLFRFIQLAHQREMFTALALLMVISIAVLMTAVGLSPALGTFLAGVVLANSEFRHELESNLEPFKGLLLGLFFVTVGAGINFATFYAAPLVILSLALGLMATKGAVLYLLARLFKLKGRDGWLFTLGLAQAGEFGFVLISVAATQHVISAGLSEILLLVTALSMLITPLLFIIFEQLGKRSKAKDTQPHDEVDEAGTVIIAGIGRFGHVVNTLVQSAGFKTVLLDNDMVAIETMRRFGFRCHYADPTRPEVLHAAGIDSAQVLVVAIDDKAAALRMVRYARRKRPDLHIIARAYDRLHVFQLHRAGADDITREMFDSSLRAGRYALENLGLSKFEASTAESTFYDHDREALLELAQLWKPALQLAHNPEYTARAKELNQELETALATNLLQLRHPEHPHKEAAE